MRPVNLLFALLPALLSAQPALAQLRQVELWSGGSQYVAPLPDAVRAAYQRLPVASRTEDDWTVWALEKRGQPTDTLYEVSYRVTRPGAADSVSYVGSASFTSQGQQRGSTRELPADSLPWRVRWHLRYDGYWLRRRQPGIAQMVLTVQYDPYARRHRSRVSYIAYFYYPRFSSDPLLLESAWPFTDYIYTRNGGHPPSAKLRN